MGKPENPNTVVLKNEFYPGGLTEGQVWNYYDKNRQQLIQEINNRLIMIFLSADFRTDLVIIRKVGGKFFTINEKNFDKLISGRTISMAVEQGKKADYWLIDIDHPVDSTENDKKMVLEDVLNFVKVQPSIKRTRVATTSTSYHVYGYLKQKMDINTTRKSLEHLLKSHFGNKYYVNKKGKKDRFNLDLSSMTPRGGHTVIGALNRNGLKCIDITNNWRQLRRTDLKVPR